MLARLLILFTIVPMVELAILIPLGQWMGLWPTLALILVTGVVGAWLGKRQGLRAWGRITDDLSSGKLPSDSLLDGLAVLIACAFLVTPGVLTDVAGMLLLIPTARKPLKGYIKKRFQKSIEGGGVTFVSFDDMDPFGGEGPGPTPGGSRDDVIDVTPEVVDPDADDADVDKKPEVIELKEDR
ncbi:MAG: FxsA family protein [Myxococcota bacterium]